MESLLQQYGGEGLSALIIYATIMLVQSWYRNRRDKDRLKVDVDRLEIDRAKTENQTIQVLTTSVQISQQALQAQQQRIDLLEAERDSSNKLRIEMQNQIDTLKDSVLSNRKETGDLQLQLKAASAKIEDLERQLRAKDEQIRAQDQKITQLRTELEKSETDRTNLQCEVEKLTLRMNGKVDKPKTDEIPELKPTEAGESAPVVEETEEEN